MNILPDIRRKNRRKPHFTNPLSGLTYNNDSFLKSCNPNQESTHSEKMIQTFNRTGLSRSMREKSNGLGYSSNHKFAQTNRQKADPEKHHYLKTTQQFLNYSNSKLTKANGSPDKTISINTEDHKPNNKSMRQIDLFPDINIKVLDVIQSHRDIADDKIKQLKVNFMHYFLTFFHSNLAGKVTKEFLMLVEKYLSGIYNKNELDKKIDSRDYPSQIFKLKSKRNFIDKLLEYEQKSEFDNIQVMIRQYCVPERSLRESCYHDILFMLSRCLYEKFNMSKTHSYVLLDSKGKLIEDICEIKFSTKLLFLTYKQKCHKMFEKYTLHLDDKQQVLKKISFSETLKKNFRQKIVHGRIEENAEKDQKNKADRKAYLESDFHLNKQNSSRKNINHHSPPKTSNTNLSRPKTNMQITNPNLILDSPKAQKLFKKTHKTPEKHQPVSPKRFEHKRGISIIEEIQTQKRMQQYKTQFKFLINQNSHYSITFNHENEDKVLMKTLRKFCNLFNNKTESQVDKILDSLELLYEKDDPKLFKEFIEWEDYIRLMEVANCKGEKNDIIQFINKYVEWNQFDEIDRYGLGRTIRFAIVHSSDQINDNFATKKSDKSDQQNLKGFIQNNQEDKRDILEDLTDDNKSVIEQIIWSWLEKNRLIENDSLSKNHLQSWFSKHKMVYVLLISLIFGTNIMSLLDMAYQVIT